MFSVFVRQKVNANENISFMDYGPGIWVPGLRKTQLNMGKRRFYMQGGIQMNTGIYSAYENTGICRVSVAIRRKHGR